MAIPSSQNTQNCQLCIANIETISLKRLEMFGGWLSILSILTRGMPTSVRFPVSQYKDVTGDAKERGWHEWR